jgi:hypothetical protein
MPTAEERLAAHEATLAQMHARLGQIEARVSGLEYRLLAVGGVLGALMTLYQCW